MFAVFLGCALLMLCFLSSAYQIDTSEYVEASILVQNPSASPVVLQVAVNCERKMAFDTSLNHVGQFIWIPFGAINFVRILWFSITSSVEMKSSLNQSVMFHQWVFHGEMAISMSFRGPPLVTKDTSPLGVASSTCCLPATQIGALIF